QSVGVRGEIRCSALFVHTEQAAAAVAKLRKSQSVHRLWVAVANDHLRSGRRPVLRPLRAISSCTSAAPRLSVSATDALPMTHSLRRSDSIEFICAASGTAYVCATLEFSACAFKKRYLGSRAS